MLINLLNTILISCGMALNGTNFNYERKEKRNSETVGIAINTNYQLISSYNYTNTQLKKYALKENNEAKINYTHPYLNITNTIYTYIFENTGNGYRSQIYEFYQITNYYNSSIDIEIEVSNLPAGGSAISQIITKSAMRSLKTNPPINLTLNSSTRTTIMDYINDTQTQWISNSQEAQTSQYTTINQTDTITPNTTKTYIFKTEGLQYNTPYQTVAPTNFTLTGTATIPTQPLEVIDVPSLMFTILAMPFSFVSQAFNLTIFPNTPYSINFSNLFLTIISIFVLIWLIKHIFK